jgi:hypothetical protein
MSYVGQNILVGQGDILDCVKSHCPTAIITAGEFKLVAAVVKKVIEPEPEVWDPDAEDKVAVELQTQTGEAIHLPGKAPLVVLTEESEGVVWFGTPAGAPHLKKEAGPPPPLQTWKALYEAGTDSFVRDIQVQTYTEWDARLAVAEALSKEPEVTGLDTPWAPSVPVTPYFWMSYAHSTFSASATELLEPGKVTYREEKILAWDELE